jgi:uncharacterized repeat protein (TIGR03803 family)
MDTPIYGGLTRGKTLLLTIGVSLLVLAGRAFNANAQTETNLYSFLGPPADGADPEGGLVQGSDGNFYGTAYQGGTSTNCPFGCGAVFRISPGGSYTNLHSFAGPPIDGANPYGGLVQGNDGNFYGTTKFGGTSNSGTVFRISAVGQLTNLWMFTGGSDGGIPFYAPVQGSDGNFYGTASIGGTNGVGAVFRISPGGSYTNLYSFGLYPDGFLPEGGLVQGSDGNFYGTTYLGGTNTNCLEGCGTVFRISPSGSYTSLYSFAGPPNDGNSPAGLVQGSDGNLYGTTAFGNTNGDGAVFRISPNGTYTNLHFFTGSPNDGRNSYAGLVQASDGNLYGTTFYGGTSTNCGSGCGTVFRISLTGSYTSLYSFFAALPNDGIAPIDGLVQGSDGNIYGTTRNGGTSHIGTVFKLTFPLNPPPYPINQVTGAKLAGSNIVFNIPSIAGETYQLQFSSSMAPTNWVNVPRVSVTNSIGALLTVTNFGGAVGPQGFYRFDITP